MLGGQRRSVHFDNSAQQSRVHARAISEHDTDVCALRVHDDRHGFLPLLRPVHVQAAAIETYGAGVADILWVRRADKPLSAVEHCRHLPDHQINDNTRHHLYPVRILRKTVLAARQAYTGTSNRP